MKNLLFLSAFVLLILGSCRSIEKMVDKGQYDEALVFAADKLAGKKNKKTRYVKGLESAFDKITARDMEMIAFLDGDVHPENWDKIYSIALNMKARQDRLKAFLPLVSKDGYRAEFEFVRTEVIMDKAAKGAASYHYGEAARMIEKARRGDRSAARVAYTSLNRVDDYYKNYRNSQALKEEALALGKTHILVRVDHRSRSFLPGGFENMLESINVNELNTRWKEFHLSGDIDQMDYLAELKIHAINVGPEKEIIDRHTDTRKIEDGWKYVLDKKGNVRKDSLGNDIKVKKFKTVRAVVTEITREKRAHVKGRMEFRDARTGDILNSEPIAVEAMFSDFMSSYRGHRSALCTRSLNSLRGHPLPFPNDLQMIRDASENLKWAFKDVLKQLNV